MSQEIYRQLVSDTLAWLKENPHRLLLSSENRAFFTRDTPTPKKVAKEAVAPPQKMQEPPSFLPKEPLPEKKEDEEIKKLLAKAPAHLQLKKRPPFVALIFHSEEERLFYTKLQSAIETHLHPARLIDVNQWEEESKIHTPKWILATQEVVNARQIPMIHLSPPELYQNNPAAKIKLWKMLCQTLSLPQSS